MAISKNDQLQLWNYREQSEKPVFEVASFPGHNARCYVSDDGQSVVQFDRNEKTLIWDLTESPPRKYESQMQCYDAILLGNTLLTAEEHGVAIYDWPHDRLIRRWDFPGPVYQILLAPDGRHIFTVNSNNTCYVLRLNESLRKQE